MISLSDRFLQLDREREERNFFQLERDKIHTFWEITRRQLEDRKAEIRNKDRETEEAEERHQVEIKGKLISKFAFKIFSKISLQTKGKTTFMGAPKCVSGITYEFYRGSQSPS